MSKWRTLNQMHVKHYRPLPEGNVMESVEYIEIGAVRELEDYRDALIAQKDQLSAENERQDQCIQELEFFSEENARLRAALEPFTTYQEWQHEKGKPDLWTLIANACEALTKYSGTIFKADYTNSGEFPDSNGDDSR